MRGKGRGGCASPSGAPRAALYIRRASWVLVEGTGDDNELGHTAALGPVASYIA